MALAHAVPDKGGKHLKLVVFRYFVNSLKIRPCALQRILPGLPDCWIKFKKRLAAYVILNSLLVSSSLRAGHMVQSPSVIKLLVHARPAE